MQSWPAAQPDYQYARSPRWVAPRLALASLAFHAAHLVGRLVSRIKRAERRVVILRTDGIGDAVLAEPLIASFAMQFPHARLELWATQPVCELYQSHPSISCRRVVPRGFKAGNVLVRRSLYWRAVLGYRMARHHYEAVAYLNHSPEPLANWLFASTRARERWYVPGDTHNQFPQQRDRAAALATWPMSIPSLPAHELTRNAWVARQWGDNIIDARPRVFVSNEAQKQATLQVENWGNQSVALGAAFLVGIVPASATSVNAYPPAQWNTVLRKLWNDAGVLAVWLSEARDAFDVVTAGVPCLTLKQPFNLIAMASLISQIDLAIGMDTGLMHIALAQRQRSVVLCGGGNPGRFFPWPGAVQAITLNYAMPCQGCNCRCTQVRARCITDIEPATIIEAVRQLLGLRITSLRVAC